MSGPATATQDTPGWPGGRGIAMLVIKRLGPLLLMVLLGATACGGDEDTTGAQTPDATPPPQTEPMTPTSSPMTTAEEMPAEDAEATVTVADSSHGMILVDQEGLSLYMFEADQQGDSTCYDDCASAWPPLVVDADPVAGEGVDQTMLGTVERTDGSLQATYGDWPLYHWAQDQQAGDVTGQGVNGVWWVIAPDGEPIRTTD